MLDQPPEATDSKNLTLDDWLGAVPAREGTQPAAATAGVKQGKDEPPDPKAGTRPHVDVLDEQTVEDRKQNRTLRDVYADKAYCLAMACLWGWAGMLVASGFVNGVRGEPLWSDKVIIAATTGVTVSVLAAFLGVIRGLFPNGGEKK